MEVSGQLYFQGKSPTTHWIGGWVGPRADMETIEKRKILPLPEIELQPSIPFPVDVYDEHIL
jgi:hypothetical protein